MILWPCNSAFAQISVSKIFAPKLSLIHSIRLQVGERVAAKPENHRPGDSKDYSHAMKKRKRACWFPSFQRPRCWFQDMKSSV